MKKTIFITLISSSLTFSQIQTPQASPSAKIEQTVGLTKVNVVYSRPAMRGRVIMGDLVPYGAIWRTGANEATEIRLNKPIKLGDKIIKAGTYTMYSYPKDNSSEIIINSAKYVWGAYRYDQSKDVARLEVPVLESTEYLEAFSLAFSGNGDKAVLHGGWGNVRVEIPITIL